MTTTTTTPADQAPGTRPRRRLRRVLAVLAAILVIIAGYATWTNTQPYTLEASIQIHASPQRVWAVLTDRAAYPHWNPFIISSHGQLKPGATLVNRMHDATGDTTFTPVLQAVDPGHELQWIGRIGPGGIFDGQHTFTIHQLRPGLVLFTQREDFTGVAVPFYEGHLMNGALAQQAER